MKYKLFVGLIILATCAFATGNFAGGMKVGRLWVDNQGIWVGFSPRPADCAGNWNGINARFASTTPNFNQILSVLLTAKSTGESVDFWYNQPTSQLSCGDPNFLLSAYGAGFSQ